MHHHDDDAHLAPVDDAMIFALTRPDNNLLPLFIIYAIASAVAFPVMMPYLYFRFRTLRYRFDNEGLAVSYGLLWRRESYLTYARIQDIHVTRNLFERWLGIGTVKIQTASGSASAEEEITGIRQFNEVRNFLYARMRGHTLQHQSLPAAETEPATTTEETLAAIRDELRGIRLAIGEGGKQHG
ncbi:MAG: PH domain-containing protein [Candidatus Kapabacteria bacterium]|nr:PH domain-containing protein [Candidatus Kapabacteria bacterium]